MGEADDGGGGAAGFEECRRGGRCLWFGTDKLGRGSRRREGIARERLSVARSVAREGVECRGGLGEDAVAEAGEFRVLLAGAEVVAGGDGLLDLRALDPLGVLEGVDGGGVVEGGEELAVALREKRRRDGETRRGG